MIPMINLNMDPSQILGLKPDAAEKEIRKNYRLLAMQYHPDRNPDDPEAEEKFRQVHRAYETLAGKKKKASMPGRAGRYERPFSGDAHPFFSFFRATRAYDNKIKRNKSARSGDSNDE